MAREKVRVKGIDILSAASLLSTDIFVYTHCGDTYKLEVENRDPRKLISVRVFSIHCKPITPNFVLVWIMDRDLWPVSQRIWTPRGFGPPGRNPLADLGPPGPYPLADLDPLRGFGPPSKHSFFPIYSNGKHLGDVL